MQDTVSFGKYDEENYNFVSKCVIRKLVAIRQLGIQGPLRDSKYLKLAPAKRYLIRSRKR